MPEPDPQPTPAEIVLVAEIAMISYGDAVAMIASGSSQTISDANWARTLLDITSWTKIGADPGNIKRVDDIEFFEGATIDGRLSFRNALRLRYGLGPLTNENSGFSNFWPRSLCWY